MQTDETKSPAHTQWDAPKDHVKISIIGKEKIPASTEAIMAISGLILCKGAGGNMARLASAEGKL